MKEYESLGPRDHRPMQRLMEVSLLVLLCGEECGACHGYALSERLADFGFDAVHVGTLYRTLRGMEEAGWVTSRWESGGQGPRRRVYAITSTGRKAMDEWAKVLKVRRDRIERLLDAYEKLGRADDPQSPENGGNA